MPQPIWFQFWTLGSADSLRAACCGSMVCNGLSITIFGIICWFLGVIIAVFVMSATHFSIFSLCKCDLAPAGPCSCLAPLPMLSWLSGKFKIFPIHFKDSKIDIVFLIVNSCLSEKERFKGISINIYTNTYNACSCMFYVCCTYFSRWNFEEITATYMTWLTMAPVKRKMQPQGQAPTVSARRQRGRGGSIHCTLKIPTAQRFHPLVPSASFSILQLLSTYDQVKVALTAFDS